MKRRGALATFALILVIIIMLGIIGGAVYLGTQTKWYTDWSIFTKQVEGERPPKDDENKKPNEPGEDEKPGGSEEGETNTVTDGEGVALVSGVNYVMPRSLVYSARTAESADASEGVTITATVTPSTAINKNVVWETTFKNPESQWATGKSVSDYFTVTPEEGEPNTVTLVCNAPFGEQIILTAKSELDPEKSASCTVDFRQKVTDCKLSFGNIPVILGGNTDITIDITSSATNRGGVVNLNYSTSEVYTISEEYETKITFLHDRNENGTVADWFSYISPSGAGRAHGISYGDPTIADSTAIYFDLRLFEQYNFDEVYYSMGGSGETVETHNYFKDSNSEIIAGLYSGRGSNNKLWELTVQIIGKQSNGIFEFKSNIIWSACTGVNVDLDNGQVIF